MAETLAGHEQCMICFESPDMYGLLENCDHNFCLSCIDIWRSSGRKRSAPDSVSEFDADDEEEEIPLFLRDHEVNYIRSHYPRTRSRPYPVAQDSDHERVGSNKFRNTGSCPLCRRPSSHVIPAAKLPRNAVEKAKLRDQRIIEMKRQLCPTFEMNLLVGRYFCPQFNDCPHAHMKAPTRPNAQRKEELFFVPERIQQIMARQDIRVLGDRFRLPRTLMAPLTQLLEVAMEAQEDVRRRRCCEVVATFRKLLIAEFKKLSNYFKMHTNAVSWEDEEELLNPVELEHICEHSYVFRLYDAAGKFIIEAEAERGQTAVFVFRRHLTSGSTVASLERIARDVRVYTPFGWKEYAFFAPLSVPTVPFRDSEGLLDHIRVQNRDFKEKFAAGAFEDQHILYHHISDDANPCVTHTRITETFPQERQSCIPLKMLHEKLGKITHYFLGDAKVVNKHRVLTRMPQFLAIQSAILIMEQGYDELPPVWEYLLEDIQQCYPLLTTYYKARTIRMLPGEDEGDVRFFQDAYFQVTDEIDDDDCGTPPPSVDGGMYDFTYDDPMFDNYHDLVRVDSDEVAAIVRLISSDSGDSEWEVPSVDWTLAPDGGEDSANEVQDYDDDDDDDVYEGNEDVCMDI